jgi:predicted amidohydrolase YtcJ
MGLMDGFTESEEVLKTYHSMDKAGHLGLFYEGAVLLESWNTFDDTIRTLKDWSKKYTTEHIRIGTVKFFMDGTNEMGDSALLGGQGHEKMDADQLAYVLTRLNKEGVDMHIHVVGDRGFRICCDAVEKAKNVCKDTWRIYVTLCHCELIHPDDAKRVAKLGIFIDWSPHWSGGYFGEAAIEYVGRDRWDTMYDFGGIIESGGTVGFSSDLFSYQEVDRGSPFLGMQIGMSRVDTEFPLDPIRFPGSIRPKKSARLSLEQLLKGYTYNNALRMRLIDEMGTLEAGKLANLIVLDRDIFKAPVSSLAAVTPELVFFEGVKTYGSA